MEEIKVEGIRVKEIKYTMPERFLSWYLSCHDQFFKARLVCSALHVTFKWCGSGVLQVWHSWKMEITI